MIWTTFLMILLLTLKKEGRRKMKKNYRFDELSSRRCKNCGEKLKKRMVKEHNATVCWKCVRMFMFMWSIGRKKVLRRVG